MVLPTYMASMQQLQQMGLTTYNPLAMSSLTNPTSLASLTASYPAIHPAMSTLASLPAIPSTVGSVPGSTQLPYSQSVQPPITNGHSGGSVSPQSPENARESPGPGYQQQQSSHPQQSSPPPPSLDEVNLEYLKELETEKESLEECASETVQKSQALKLLEQEISRIQSGGNKNGGYKEPVKYFDIYRERPIRLTIRALVPVREHPKFNFVGKLLGPKGNSMKRLQEETMTKMAVLGRGSMRDKQKEEDLRLSNDPKYQHLHEELHVEITAFAPPAEAHARIAYALTEVRKYLIPDSNDDIRQEQMREMEVMCTGVEGAPQQPNIPLDPLKQVPVPQGPNGLNPAIAGLRSQNLTLAATSPHASLGVLQGLSTNQLSSLSTNQLSSLSSSQLSSLSGYRPTNGYIAAPYVANTANLQLDPAVTTATNIADQYSTSSSLVDPSGQWHNLKAASSLDTSKHRVQASPYSKPI